MAVAPSRARGLKHLGTQEVTFATNVAPSRARGLKLYYLRELFSEEPCRALTGAWIETCSRRRMS